MHRGPNARRQQAQVAEIFRHASVTATWRQYISATTGTPDAGLGDTYHYREQTITALIGLGRLRAPEERQTPAGMLTSGEYQCTTREKLGRRDELIWRGVTYRIESEPIASHIGPHWVCKIKEGN